MEATQPSTAMLCSRYKVSPKPRCGQIASRQRRSIIKQFNSDIPPTRNISLSSQRSDQAPRLSPRLSCWTVSPIMNEVIPQRMDSLAGAIFSVSYVLSFPVSVFDSPMPEIFAAQAFSPPAFKRRESDFDFNRQTPGLPTPSDSEVSSLGLWDCYTPSHAFSRSVERELL